MHSIQPEPKSMMDSGYCYLKETVMGHASGKPRDRDPEVEAQYRQALARMTETDRDYTENVNASLGRIKAWADERFETAQQEKEQREKETVHLRQEALAAQQARFAEMDAIRRGEVDLRELFPDFPFPERHKAQSPETGDS